MAQTVSPDPDLKSCPFCGGEAEPFEAHYGDDDVKEKGWEQSFFHGVSCADCNAQAMGWPGHKTPESAAEHWNLRTKVLEDVT